MAKKQVMKEEVQEEKTEQKVSKKAPVENLYTYVGGGEDSPRVIVFMGRQTFVRGKAEVVTDPDLLKKIANHPCFFKGEVEEEELHEYDQEAKKEAEAQRKKDKAIDAAAKRANNKWATKGDDY